MKIDDWFSGGRRISVRSPEMTHGSRDFELFCRVESSGPWLTLLHGFPACSWDWAKVKNRLTPHVRMLMFDFLGFGDSAKPADHRYSLIHQADFTEALWRHFGVETTGLVAHDYGATVALELMSRQAEGRLGARIGSVLLLNAGLYVDLIRPVLLQSLLQVRLLGNVLSRLINEWSFSRQFSSVFSLAHPISASDVHQYWLSIVRRGGRRSAHRVIRYLTERRQNRARWEGTLENAPVPIRFVWGADDPVSRRHMAEHIKSRIPGADLILLPDIGHYPHLEAPVLVAEEIKNTFAVGRSD